MISSVISWERGCRDRRKGGEEGDSTIHDTQHTESAKKRGQNAEDAGLSVIATNFLVVYGKKNGEEGKEGKKRRLGREGREEEGARRGREEEEEGR